MFLDNNQKDIKHFMYEPNLLIIHYQGLIDSIINVFIRSGNFRYHEHAEIKQQINEELLIKLPKILIQYQNKSPLKTYIAAIVRNICNEIVRKKIKSNITYLEEFVAYETSYNLIDSLVIEDEKRRLKMALHMYNKQEPKLMLCLKLRFRMPFNITDFTQLFQKFSPEDFDFFIEKIQPYKEISDLAIFSALTTLFNKYKDKDNTPGALRKWIAVKIAELVKLLNGNPPTYFYTEETFQILFERCFFNESEIISKIH